MKKSLFLVATIAFVGLAFFFHATPVHADFVANDIMDDGVFDNSNSMSAAQIDGWLNANFPHSCISTNNGFSAPDPNGYSPSTGYVYGGAVSAGRVIYDAAQAYGINPQVLIATLEKESSVVTGNASYHCQYINTAMGYDCPDSGSCPQNPATESGFSKQIIHAAWLLRFHEQRSEGNVAWQQSSPGWDNSDDPQSCYSGRMTQGNRQTCPGGATTFYDGYTTIDGTSVHLDTGATAALYDYTPHFHGNQLFVSYFEQWFGSTTGELVRTPTNAQVYIVNSNNNTKYPVNSAGIMNDFGILGLRYVTDAYLAAYTNLGHPVDNMVQGPDQTLYLVNAGIKLSFSSCSGDVLDYGFTCASSQYIPLTTGQANKLVSGPGVTKLIKSNSNGTIYYMTGGAKRPIPGWSDLTSLNLPISYNVLTTALVSEFPTGPLLFGAGSLVVTGNSSTVYIVENQNELIPISSFVYPQDLGLPLAVRGMSASDFQSYTVEPGIQTKIKCGTTDYVGTGGLLYNVTSSLSTFGFQASDFVDVGSFCSSLPMATQTLGNFIRVNNGTVFYVSGGQKQAFTNYNAYVAHGGTNSNTVSVSDYFATLIPSGANITQ
jgi:hypothetical protein